MSETDANACVYYDFNLSIVDEDGTSFWLSNRGESVGEGAAINTQFMLMKDVLGFTQTDVGSFATKISKFDSNIRVAATKLVFYRGWLLRVVDARADEVQLAVVGSGFDTSDWQRHGDLAKKWVKIAETSDVQPYIEYWIK